MSTASVIIPQGIPNTGNFCYIISSLQALFNNKTIIKYMLVDNLKVDDVLFKLMDVFGINDNIYKKEEIVKIVNNRIREILSNNTEYKKLLNELNLNKKTFLVITKKIKDNIYPIYIYVYFQKLFKLYNIICNENSKIYLDDENDNKEKKMYHTRMIYQTFMQYVKLNNVILHNMGITELVDGNQHDVQEYILTLLDILNDSHTFEMVGELDEEIANLSDNELNKLNLDKRILYGYKKTFHNYNKAGYTSLKTNLYFYTTQFIDCRNCDFKSISYQENNMLSLPIPTNNNIETEPITIYDCMDLYFGIEVMDYEYKCENCEQKVTKNILSKKILTKPDTLIVFLKRFNFNMETMQMSKNNNMVVYPFILNMSKYFIHNDNNISYKLKSVICHKGVMNYGHYYSYICKDNLDSSTETWFKCNDEHVMEIKNNDSFTNEIVNNCAYILFYEIIDN